jgi:aminoglycoside phosphotransferase family enzyme/predicted kinase
MQAESWEPQVAESHISVVVLLGERAFKLKKPVRLPFVDLSTRERREALCHREVELNRRLAPDVYLGVLSICGPDGEPLDHLVAMRRMPAGRRLSRLVGNDPEIGSHLQEVARVVAAFHAQAATSADIDAAATPDAVRKLWEDNASGLRPFVGRLLPVAQAEAVERQALRYVDGRSRLFERRIAEGHVRDGHGDLLADDVFCLDDGPRILDCLEFDDRLRYGDVLLDVAFLAMDLERLGTPDLAQRFLDWYAEFSGRSVPASLAGHYVAYRAHVRSKVACLRHDQGVEEAADEARFLLDLAHRHLEETAVRLVLVGGLPGTGKSTLARGLADARGWVVLRSDEVRKELADLPSAASAPSAWGEGLYRPERTAATYDELLRRASIALAEGESVVLDASWAHRRFREEAARATETVAAELVELHCTAPPEVAAARIRSRPSTDPSDATAEIAARMAEETDPWPSATPIDTSGPPEAALAATLDIVATVPARRESSETP